MREMFGFNFNILNIDLSPNFSLYFKQQIPYFYYVNAKNAKKNNDR